MKRKNYKRELVIVDKQKAKETVEKILQESHIGTMATVENGKPNSRYMTFFNDGFTLYSATSKKTHKTEELQKNPYTHILLGYEGEGFGDEYVEVAGKVSEDDSEGLKEKIWNEQLAMYFDGPEDPEMIILKVEPEEIRLMNKKGQGPITIDM